MNINYEDINNVKNNFNPEQEKAKQISKDSYIIITQEMIMDERFSSFTKNELLAYALIYGMCCNSERRQFDASNVYLAARIGCNEATANRTLKKLVEKGLIHKSETPNHYGQYIYTIVESEDNNIEYYEQSEVKEKRQPKKQKYTEEEKEQIDEVIDYLNEKTGKRYRHIDSTMKLIYARLKEGFTVEDLKYVIDVKTAQWKGTDFEQYLRPKTLFNSSKFEDYLNTPMPQQGIIYYDENGNKHIKKPDEDWPVYTYDKFGRRTFHDPSKYNADLTDDGDDDEISDVVFKFKRA